MSNGPSDYQEQLRLLNEQIPRNPRVLTVRGLLQNPNEGANQASGSSLPMPIDAEQDRLPAQAVQQIFQMAQHAAQMAEDAASMARNAADMARNAADMARQVANVAAQGPRMPFDHYNHSSMPAQNSAYMPPNPATFQAQTPQVLDQPIENYQSQFSIAKGNQRRKNKKRAATDEAESPSRPGVTIAPNVNAQPQHPGNGLLDDYQMQLMLLEQQRKKRASIANPATGYTGNHALQDYQLQMQLLEQHNRKKDQENRERLTGGGTADESAQGSGS